MNSQKIKKTQFDKNLKPIYIYTGGIFINKTFSIQEKDRLAGCYCYSRFAA